MISLKKTDWKTQKEHGIHPTWKVHSDRYKGCRPQHLIFPHFRAKIDSCDLHNNKPDHPQTRLNAQGLSCPCTSTGNVDITTVVEFLCRQLGFRDPMRGRPCEKTSMARGETWLQLRSISSVDNADRPLAWIFSVFQKRSLSRPP